MDFDYSIHYFRAHPLNPRLREEQIDSFRQRLVAHLDGCPRGKAVDVGAGFGLGVLALKRLGFDAIGLERDPHLVRAARGIHAPVVECDDLVDQLSERAGTLSAIVMFDVLEHVELHRQLPLLRSAHDALHHGGRLVLQVPNATSPVAAHRRYADWTHTCSFTDRSLDFLLRNAGFVAVSTDRHHVRAIPPLGVWRRGWLSRFRRWMVHALWRQVVLAELGGELGGEIPPLGTDLVCVAIRE